MPALIEAWRQSWSRDRLLTLALFVILVVILPLAKFTWYELGTNANILKASVGKRVEREFDAFGAPATSRGPPFAARYHFEPERWGFFCLWVSISGEANFPGDVVPNYGTAPWLEPWQVDEVRFLE